ncbi:MAG: 16S rRNA (guanine(527)-N(7))-methyltransferase RsmG [Bifidobacteriaceae bacterium]|nr:16S rRNA (guanine(527)-N(7))-methyltransferase RsmG [Bifidobacteriaceae bacterium]
MTLEPDVWVREFFGGHWPDVARLADLLRANAERRGLMGPREMERLWDRHLVNCGVLANLLPASGLVVDVGSGAGLPGLVLAIMRPGLDFELVDSMRRRADWLTEAAALLGLPNTVVTLGRAEELESRAAAAVVSRAVAPLDKLADWTADLLAPGGRFLALKGDTAPAELARCRLALTRRGLSEAAVLTLAPPGAPRPTYVVRAVKTRGRGSGRRSQR